MAKLNYLKEDYPAVYIDYCKLNDMQEEQAKYIFECLTLLDVEAEKYVKYIQGGVIPLIESQRKEGLLEKGKFLKSIHRIFSDW